MEGSAPKTLPTLGFVHPTSGKEEPAAVAEAAHTAIVEGHPRLASADYGTFRPDTTFDVDVSVASATFKAWPFAPEPRGVYSFHP